jgi:hypothetical protein
VAGKAEDAKLQDAGISPKQSQEKERQKKGGLRGSKRIVEEIRGES